MYSDLRSKLEMYKKNIHDVKPEKKPEDPGLIDIEGGTLQYNGAGAFFVIENQFPYPHEHGYCNLQDILNMDITPVLKVCREASSSPKIHDLVFLDTETTGLSVGTGTIAFLIGIGFFSSDTFVLRQYLIRDYNEETAVLTVLNDTLSRYKGLVTFNGKAFDWNLLTSRFIFNRIRPLLKNPIHLDLLYPSRMLWKRKLESCRLSSLEDNILGIHRVDDIPGAFIPGIYFRYLSDRNTKDLKKVIEHNRLDVLSMVSLMVKINSVLDNPFTCASDSWELFSAGQILEKFDDSNTALRCYEQCAALQSGTLKEAALKRLSMYYKGQKDFIKSANCLETLLSCSTWKNIPVMIELAKLYEHRIKNFPRACELVQEAIKACLMMAFLRNAYHEDLSKRLERLKRKSELHCLRHR